MNLIYLQWSLFKSGKHKPFIVSLSLFSAITLFSLLFWEGDALPFQLVWAFAYSAAAYRLFQTGKITLYRRILFVSLAVLFIACFKVLFASRPYYPGPACPIALSYTFPAVIRNLAANWHSWTFFLPAVITLGAVFFIGRIWCSWVCWFGGIDECFSSLSRRRPVSLAAAAKHLSELPAAVLLFLALAAFAGGTAVFCLWACPLKMSTSLASSAALLRFFQIFLFVAVGAVFLVALPLLSGKRTFCRFVCPLRALFRWTAGFHPLRIAINTAACDRCGKCIERCRSLAIGNDYTVSPYCDFCLECFEICPRNAVETNPRVPLLLFLSLLFSGAVSSLFIPGFLRLLRG